MLIKLHTLNVCTVFNTIFFQQILWSSKSFTSCNVFTTRKQKQEHCFFLKIDDQTTWLKFLEEMDIEQIVFLTQNSMGLEQFLYRWRRKVQGITCRAFDIWAILNLGGDMNVSSRWSITNVKRYCRQTGLLLSVLVLV